MSRRVETDVVKKFVCVCLSVSVSTVSTASTASTVITVSTVSTVVADTDKPDICDYVAVPMLTVHTHTMDTQSYSHTTHTVAV